MSELRTSYPLHMFINVYELMADTHTNTSSALSKQNNGPYLVTDIHVERKLTTVKNILTDIHPTDNVLKIFPLNELPEDKELIFTIITGYRYDFVQDGDPTKPIVQYTNMTEEERLDQYRKVLEPTTISVHFTAIIPETEKYMFDLSFSHVPETAISMRDSSKQEVDPHLDDDGALPLAVEPFGGHIA